MTIGSRWASAGYGFVVASGLLVALAVSPPPASPAIGAPATKLCAALSPPKVALPRTLRSLGLENYSLPLSSDAVAHHGLCSVGLSSPSDDYADNVGWDVFPSHALAVADFTSYSASDLYRAISVDRGAEGFPSPNFEVVGAGKLTGKTVSVIAFVDGTAIVSAYIYAPADRLAAVRPIAQWALREIKALTSIARARRT